MANQVEDDPIVVVAYDARWTERFERLALELRDALAEQALRIDHIGSTSVFGLAAKPNVDLQISVERLDAGSPYRAGLESIGYAFFPDDDPAHHFFRVPGTPRIAHLHVRQAGGAWERKHLLFRDYLRARPAERDAYGALELELEQRFRNDRRACTNAKSPMIAEMLHLAEAWAAEIGWAP